MTTQEALEVKKALETLGSVTGLPPDRIAKAIGIFHAEGFQKLKEASIIWNEFYDCDIVERGRLLGFEIILSKK